MEVINYIRNLFNPIQFNTIKRKRSFGYSDEEFEVPILTKLRKMSSGHLEDDWLAKSTLQRKPSLEPIRLRPSWMSSNVPIVIDDDDTVPKNVNGLDNKPNCFSSTPRTSFRENGFDFSSKQNSEKKPFDKKENSLGFSFKFSNTSSGRKPLSFNLKPEKIDLTANDSVYYTPGMKSIVSECRPSSSIAKKTSLFPTNDFIFRLDEKHKYEELLRKSASRSSINLDSFAEYSTPIGRNYGLLKPRTERIIDLTRELNSKYPMNDSKGQQKTATSQTIQKVLDKFDDDVVVVKDSDSDVEEVMPTRRRNGMSPPSPEPDIKVDRVNSLKSSIVACDPLKDNWVEEKVRKHAEEIDYMKREIETRKENLKEFRKINDELLKIQLAYQVKKCLRIRETVIPLDEEEEQPLPELTDDHLQMVESAFSRQRNPNEVLASKFSLNITRRDMHTLAGLNWLNDEVINFYMNLIIERGKCDKYPSVYAFNTFFYPKILREGQQGVRRWTRKVDVFAHDAICVPIHLSMHWCMAVIDFRNKTINYYDSMGKPNKQCTDALLQYLQDEHRDKKGKEFATNDWQLKCPKDIPQQMNGSDCGMFSCTFAEFQSRNAPFNFSQDQMPYFRKKMVVEIMLGRLLIS